MLYLKYTMKALKNIIAWPQFSLDSLLFLMSPSKLKFFSSNNLLTNDFNPKPIKKCAIFLVYSDILHSPFLMFYGMLKYINPSKEHLSYCQSCLWGELWQSQILFYLYLTVSRCLHLRAFQLLFRHTFHISTIKQ